MRYEIVAMRGRPSVTKKYEQRLELNGGGFPIPLLQSRKIILCLR